MKFHFLLSSRGVISVRYITIVNPNHVVALSVKQTKIYKNRSTQDSSTPVLSKNHPFWGELQLASPFSNCHQSLLNKEGCSSGAGLANCSDVCSPFGTLILRNSTYSWQKPGWTKKHVFNFGNSPGNPIWSNIGHFCSSHFGHANLSSSDV